MLIVLLVTLHSMVKIQSMKHLMSEKKFAKDFEGCTLTELRYDKDVENRFAEEIEKYHKENNQELIVVLSTFNTDEKGGDGSFNSNDTYDNWQWKTADKKSWKIINCGY